MIRFVLMLLLLVIPGGGLGGCGAKKAPMTGFLSDYSQLETVNDSTLTYLSPRLVEYDGVIVDVVQLRAGSESAMTDEQRTEATQYFRERFIGVLRDNGYRVEEEAAPGTARFRLALTDLTQATWWLNLHFGSKLTGLGTGGAAMEGEVVDSMTGEQLAALVQSGRGNQFEFDHFSALDDIKDVIDQWASQADTHLRELRTSAAEVTAP